MKIFKLLQEKTWLLIILGFILAGGIAGYYLLGEQDQSKSPVLAATRSQSGEGITEEQAYQRKTKGQAYQEMVREDKETSPENINTDTVAKPVSTYLYRKAFRDPFADYLPPDNIKNRQVAIVKETREAGSTQVSREANASSGVASTGSNNQVEFITPQSLRANLPFKLKGIVGNSRNWLTIIEEGGATRLCRVGEIIKEYRIVSIAEDSLQLSYRSIKFKLQLRGGSGGR